MAFQAFWCFKTTCWYSTLLICFECFHVEFLSAGFMHLTTPTEEFFSTLWVFCKHLHYKNVDSLSVDGRLPPLSRALSLHLAEIIHFVDSVVKAVLANIISIPKGMLFSELTNGVDHLDARCLYCSKPLTAKYDWEPPPQMSWLAWFQIQYLLVWHSR